MDPDAYYKIVDEAWSFKFLAWYSERMNKLIFPACSDLFDVQIRKTIWIMDFKGFHLGLWNKRVITMLKQTAMFAQNYYPVTMEKVFVVNTPMVFSICWAVIKLWLDERVRDSTFILGSGFYATLTEHIDEDTIPTFLGG